MLHSIVGLALTGLISDGDFFCCFGDDGRPIEDDGRPIEVVADSVFRFGIRFTAPVVYR